MIKNRIASIIVLFAILAYGFLRIWFCRLYADIVYSGLQLLNYNPDNLLQKLNSFSLAEENQDYYLGWLIYYPSYLLLHLIFIFFLFSSNLKARNNIWLGLISIVFGLIALIIVSKMLHINFLYQVAYKTFQYLFGLPFILLSIEGGKLILQDIDNLLKR